MYSSKQKKLALESLERIFRSDGFAKAPKLRKFLDFVVQKTLTGHTNEIKGYTIGVDALGRNADFDPHSDPTVRVMAGRLRQALKIYHAEHPDAPGAIITIPKGTYVPEIHFSPVSLSQSNTGKPKLNAYQSGMLAILLSVFALVAITYFRPAINHTRTIVSANTHNTARIGVSLSVNEGEIPQWFSAREAIAGLVDAFSKFNEFEIYQEPSGNLKTESASILADYHFSVLIARAGTSQGIRAFTKLRRQGDGAIVWSKTLEFAKPENLTGVDTTQLAGRIISPLLSPHGVIYGDISNLKSVPGNLECFNRLYAYFAAETREKYSSARKCIKSIIQSKSASSSIYAMQAFLQIENYRKQISGHEADPLSAAKLSAQKAIELDPQNARAHQAQFGMFKVKRHEARAIKAAKMAIELNPFDTDIICDLAAFLVSIGRFDQAQNLLNKALLLNSSLPVWLEFYIFLNAELTADFAKADVSASHLNAQASPLAAIGVVMAAYRNNNIQDAINAYQILIAQEEDFASSPLVALLRRGFSKKIASQISSTLLAVKQKI